MSGIEVVSGQFDKLILRDVNGHITPQVGIEGIDFSSADADLELVGDPQGVDISVTGRNAVGINIGHDTSIPTVGGDDTANSVLLTYWGDIHTDGLYGHGIRAGGGSVSIEYHGSIEMLGNLNNGINIHNDPGTGNGLLAVRHYGNIESWGETSRGINIWADDSNPVSVFHEGVINLHGEAVSYGIKVASGNGKKEPGGQIDVVQRGEIHAHNGIVVHLGFNAGTDDLTIRQYGVIVAKSQTGIYAQVDGSGNITVFHTGVITSAEIGIAALKYGTGGSGKLTLGQAARALDGSTLTGSTITSGSIGVLLPKGVDNELNLYNEVTISGADKDVSAVRSPASKHTINNYGTLTMLGHSDLGKGTNAFNNYGEFNSGLTVDLADGNLFTNQGIVSVHGDGVIGTTELTGNWQGDAGSRIDMDAVIDNGAIGEADLLKISGSTSGTTLVFVNDMDGPVDASEHNVEQGKMIIEVDGASDGVFVLGEQMFDGIIEYDLFKTNNQDWYLQSLIRDSATGSVFMAHSLRNFGRAVTGTSNTRTGPDTGPGSGGGGGGGGGGDEYGLMLEQVSGNGGWARVIGGSSETEATFKAAGMSNEASLDENLWALQGGIKLFSTDGSVSGSLFLHYGSLDADQTNDTRNRSAGSIEAEAWGGGANITLKAADDFYLDTVATVTTYEIDTNDSNGDKASTDGLGWSLSAEAGKRLDMTDQFTVTPQAQMIYQKITIDDYEAADGSSVSVSNEDSLELRVGTTFEFTLDDQTQLYSGLNIVHEFFDAPTSQFDGIAVTTGIDGTGYEVQLGLRNELNDGRLAIWAEASYRGPIGDGAQNWSATGGVSHRF